MDDIRIPLLGLGLLLIAGIYIWGRTIGFRRQRRNRRKPEFAPGKLMAGDARAATPQRRPDHLDTEIPSLNVDDVPQSALSSATDDLPLAGTGSKAKAGSGQTRQPARDEAGQGPVQVEFAFEQEPLAPPPGPEPEPEHPSAAPSATQAEDIIPLYVCAPKGHTYHGRDILRAVNDVGMNFGEMNIFQHYGIGDLASDTALFNMANMLEPGSFDLSHVDALETPGLALFMRLPGPADPLLMFELMLNTAERLVHHLGGDIRDEHHHPLDAAAIDKLRQRAAACR